MTFASLLLTSVLALLGLFLAAPASSAAEPLVLPLWPGKVPGDHGTIGEERVRKPEEAPTKDATWITNVTKPTLTVFPAPKEKNTGAAMIVCPGGGYWNLAWDLEGTEVAAWLNRAGITGIVLKYRCPRRPGEPVELPAPGPLLDVQRAVSLVRSHAEEWRIDPHRIGTVGFSAGGHLSIAAATQFDRRGYEAMDDADRASCRPDFAVACYSGYLASKETGALASHIRIPEGTPAILLVHAGDDPVSDVENSVVMYLALKRAKVPAELIVYASGGHGFGVRKSERACSTWTDRCLDWLKDQRLLER